MSAPPDAEYVFAGTALIGLDRLHNHRADLVPGGDVKERALAILASERQADACKISALQILAKHDAPAALFRARDYLEGDAPVMLKVSALAALGIVGQESDRPLLEHCAKSPELRMRTAARAALAKRFRSEPDKSETGLRFNPAGSSALTDDNSRFVALAIVEVEKRSLSLDGRVPVCTREEHIVTVKFLPPASVRGGSFIIKFDEATGEVISRRFWR